MIPPVFMFVRIKEKGRTVFLLPLPFILLWPFIIILPLAVVPLLAIIQVFLHLADRPLPLCRAVFSYFEILGSLRGLQVYVDGKSDNSKVNVVIW